MPHRVFGRVAAHTSAIVAFEHWRDRTVINPPNCDFGDLQNQHALEKKFFRACVRVLARADGLRPATGYSTRRSRQRRIYSSSRVAQSQESMTPVCSYPGEPIAWLHAPQRVLFGWAAWIVKRIVHNGDAQLVWGMSWWSLWAQFSRPWSMPLSSFRRTWIFGFSFCEFSFSRS